MARAPGLATGRAVATDRAENPPDLGIRKWMIRPRIGRARFACHRVRQRFKLAIRILQTAFAQRME